jgi:hypothetical protein
VAAVYPATAPQAVIWESTNPEVATVNSLTGQVIAATRTGVASIIVTTADGKVSDCITVWVSNYPTNYYTLEQFGGMANNLYFDNSAALSRAITELNGTGSTLILSSGTYYFYTPITVTSPIFNLNISGSHVYYGVGMDYPTTGIVYTGSGTMLTFNVPASLLSLEYINWTLSPNNSPMQFNSPLSNSKLANINITGGASAIRILDAHDNLTVSNVYRNGGNGVVYE